MSTEDNKALVRRYYEEVLTRRDPQLVDELFSPDYVYHFTDTPQDSAMIGKASNSSSLTS